MGNKEYGRAIPGQGIVGYLQVSPLKLEFIFLRMTIL